MKSLRQVLAEAQKNNEVIWHFNVGSYEQLEAIARVSQKRNIPFIIGVSEGERDAWGISQIVYLIRGYRNRGVALYLNADHTHSFEKIQEAVVAGFDAVLFDAGKKDLTENIFETKKIVEWVKEYNTIHGSDVLVEGELGYIGSSSVMLESLPSDMSALTSIADAKMFCEQTGVDLYAPAVGNIHGILKNGTNPLLDIQRINELTKTISVPMVLHGGSGTPNIKEAIQAGICVVHISTELRIAWRKGFESAFTQYPDEVVPYHIIPSVIQTIEHAIEEKIDMVYTKQ